MGNVSVSVAVTSTALDQIVSTNACNQVPDLPASYASLQLEGSHMVINLGDCMYVLANFWVRIAVAISGHERQGLMTTSVWKQGGSLRRLKSQSVWREIKGMSVVTHR